MELDKKELHRVEQVQMFLQQEPKYNLVPPPPLPHPLLVKVETNQE